MHGRPTTGSVLQILNEDLDNGRVIYRSYAKTDRSSVWRNRNNYYWKSAAFVTRKLRELSEDGPSALEAWSCSGGCSVRFYSERLFRKPDNLETVSLVGRYLAGRARERLRQSTRSRSVGHRVFAVKEGRPIHDTLSVQGTVAGDRVVVGRSLPRGSWKRLPPLSRRCTHHAKQHGRIGVSRLTREGAFERPVTVLERPYHLSYPFVFRWRDTWFMMPESSKASRIEIFSARQFPWEWTSEAVLFDSVHAVDSTLICVEGRWWLFTNMSPHAAIRNYDELYAFHAPTPSGPWKAHRRNPVKSDARSARAAGSFFWTGNALYRPSQDCSGRYGSAIVINRVDQLTPDVFKETIVARVEPRWRSGLSGTYTLNSCSGLTVIDFRHGRARYSGASEVLR